jgi:hypothetical protein
LKLLYALVLVLPSLAASAQTQDASIIASYYLDGCSCEMIDQSTPPAVAVSELVIETLLDEAVEEGNDISITGSNEVKAFSFGAIEPDAIPQIRKTMISTPMPATEAIIRSLTDGAAETDEALEARVPAEHASVGEISEETQVIQGTLPVPIVTSRPAISESAAILHEVDGIINEEALLWD